MARLPRIPWIVLLGSHVAACGGDDEHRSFDASSVLDAASIDAPSLDAAATDAAAGPDAPLDAPVACPARLTVADDGPGGGPQTLVISEINPGEYIELYNNSDATLVTASTTLYFCARPSYPTIESTAPGLTIPARSFRTIPWPSAFSDADAGGEIAIYGSSSFGDPGSVMDFVCWGTNPHGSRKTEAETAGKWSGACAPALTGGAIHRLTGTAGNLAAHYDTASAPSPVTCTPAP